MAAKAQTEQSLTLNSVVDSLPCAGGLNPH